MPRQLAHSSKPRDRRGGGLRRWWCLLFVLGGLLSTTEARAQRVLLVRPRAPDAVLLEAFNRLRAELSLQRFEVLVVDADADVATPEALGDAAEREGAFAGISLSLRAGRRAADVWLADRVTGKTTLRTLALPPTRDAPSVLAVRAVDLLRSSLKELDTDTPPPADVVGVDRKPIPAEVRAFAAPPPAPFALSIGGTALAQVSALGVAYGPSASLEHRFGPRWRAGLTVAGPLLGASFQARGGRAFVRQELGVVEAKLVALHADWLDLSLALGFGVYHVQARGEVDPPLVATSDQVTSALGSAALELFAHVTRNVGLLASVAALGLLPRPGVAVDTDRLLFRLPLVRPTLAVAVDF